jgi:hypothetical protein
MDANELRALQAPLKKRYREQPDTALMPARAEAMLDLDRIACHVRSWGGETSAGLHPATGGEGNLACSADMLLEALVACAGVTISAVSTAMGVKLHGGRVIAEGHWDARGTLGVNREAPVGRSSIRWRSANASTPASSSCRLTSMSGSPGTTNSGHIRGAGATARRQCKPSLAPSHSPGRNHWPPDVGQTQPFRHQTGRLPRKT